MVTISQAPPSAKLIHKCIYMNKNSHFSASEFKGHSVLFVKGGEPSLLSMVSPLASVLEEELVSTVECD